MPSTKPGAIHLELVPTLLEGVVVTASSKDGRAGILRLVDALVAALERRAGEAGLAVADQLAAQAAAVQLSRVAEVV